MILGIGVDVVDLERVERMLARFGERALTRLFTRGELEYAAPRAHATASLAARIAAKEAAFKALAGTFAARSIGWRDLEVVSGEHGIPSMRFHGPAAARATELGVGRVFLSLTHGDTSAVAMVVLEG